MNIIKRVLTMKSKLGFGCYKNCTIADLFVMRKQCYLIGVYCSLDKIDYNEEILDKLFIPRYMRIGKPGKSFLMREALIRHYIKEERRQLGPLACMKIASNWKKTKKINQLNRQMSREAVKNSRMRLAWANQGHY